MLLFDKETIVWTCNAPAKNLHQKKKKKKKQQQQP